MRWGGPVTTKFESIQFLRFVAAALVVVTHATLFAQERLSPEFPVWHFGVMGVDIFFVISGFVMMVSVQRLLPRDNPAREFALRRIIRIVPMYWLATTLKILTLLLVPALVLHAGLNARTVGLSFLFIPHTNPQGSITPIHAVGWTLVFEMFFYAVFTLALLLRARLLLFCGAVLSSLAVLGAFADSSWPAVSFYASPIVLYFLAGMVIGSHVVEPDRRRLAIGLGYVVALFGAIELYATLDGQGTDLWNSGFRHLVAIGLVLVLVSSRVSTRTWPRWSTFLGDSSYSLYLFHPFIAPLAPAGLAVLGFGDLGGAGIALSIVLSVSSAVVGAALIYLLVEKPTTRWLQSRLLGRRPDVAPLSR